MKRHLIFLIVICFARGAIGQMRVTEEEARDAAMSYYQMVVDDPKGNYFAGKPESFSLLGKAEMWLVPVNDSWVLVSSDKRTEAILAHFMTSEKPDLKSYPPAAQYLISGYEHDIAYVRDNCKDCPIRDSWKETPHNIAQRAMQDLSYPSAVTPLLSTLWKQTGNSSDTIQCSKVYNKYCPTINTSEPYFCDHAAAGCVAVAVAQILRYWNWPYAAAIPTTVGGSIVDMHFYDWSLMPDELFNSTSDVKVDAVASLLRDCGYDLGMNYGESSGASDADAKNTFINFGYSNSTITLKYKWNTPGWTNSLHSEIAAGRPVYYAGYEDATLTEGHAFILDGYNAMGLYHVNVGWGPGYNDYYRIDAITVGTSSFSYHQSAIWGIQPNPGYCSPITLVMALGPKFCYAFEGAITLNNVHMSNIVDGRFYSETGIHLKNGTYVTSGSNVQFAIKPIPCQPPITPSYAPSNNIVTVENTIENDVSNVVTEYDLASLTDLHIYSMDGKLLWYNKDGDMSTNLLPNGVYIMTAITEGGDVFQSKVIIQR